MATITNPNDPNKDSSKPIEKTTVNSASPSQSAGMANPAAASGVPVGSGQFSTLQKYLGANKDAGSRITNQLGANLSNEANTANTKTTQGINQAQASNDAFKGLTDQTTGLTSSLSQGTTAQTQSDPTKGYDVNTYNATVSGQQAAKDIAANQASLDNFAKIRDDKARAESQAASQKAAADAQSAALKQEEVNKQRQKDLTNESNRQSLLANVLNTKNQRSGVQSLDNAFLSLDKNNSVNTINNNLKTAQNAIQANKAQADTKANAIAGLNTNQSAAQTDLLNRLSGMQTDYDKILTDRVSSVNAAKDQRLDSLNNQFANLRDNQETTADFANLMKLQDVTNGRSGRYAPPGQVVAQGTGPYDGLNLFDTASGKRLQDFMDTSKLENKAAGSTQVLKQQDIDTLKAIRALSGMTPQEDALSQFTGEQLGDSTLGQSVNTRAAEVMGQKVDPVFRGGSRAGVKYYNTDIPYTVADLAYMKDIHNQFGPGSEPQAYQNFIDKGLFRAHGGDDWDLGAVQNTEQYKNIENILKRLKIKEPTNG